MTNIFSDPGPGPLQKTCRNNIALLMILGLLCFYWIFSKSSEPCDNQKNHSVNINYNYNYNYNYNVICVLMLFVLLQDEKIIADRRGQLELIFSIVCAHHFYPVLGDVFSLHQYSLLEWIHWNGKCGTRRKVSERTYRQSWRWGLRM